LLYRDVLIHTTGSFSGRLYQLSEGITVNNPQWHGFLWRGTAYLQRGRRKSLATRAQGPTGGGETTYFQPVTPTQKKGAALFPGSVKEAVWQRLEKEPKTIPFKTPSRPTPLEESRETQRQERAGSGPDKDSARVRTRLQRPFSRQFTGRQQLTSQSAVLASTLDRATGTVKEHPIRPQSLDTKAQQMKPASTRHSHGITW